MVAQPEGKLSLTEFLAWENTQEVRHEFVGGEVFAMVGVRRAHGVVTMNLAYALKHHLQGSRCQVFTESLKVQVFDNIFYPDLFVTCSEKDLRTEMIFTEPVLIIEVQSGVTAGYDRGLKFAYYRAIATLQEYAIVEPESKRIEVFRKLPQGVFGLYDYTGSEAVTFASQGLTVPLAEVFEGVDPVVPTADG